MIQHPYHWELNPSIVHVGVASYLCQWSLAPLMKRWSLRSSTTARSSNLHTQHTNSTLGQRTQPLTSLLHTTPHITTPHNPSHHYSTQPLTSLLHTTPHITTPHNPSHHYSTQPLTSLLHTTPHITTPHNPSHHYSTQPLTSLPHTTPHITTPHNPSHHCPTQPLTSLLHTTPHITPTHSPSHSQNRCRLLFMFTVAGLSKTVSGDVGKTRADVLTNSYQDLCLRGPPAVWQDPL